MADAKPAAKPAAAQMKANGGDAAQEPDIEAGNEAYHGFEADPAKADWENQRDQRDESAQAAYGRDYHELSNVEQTMVHGGFDSGVGPQNPAGAASAPPAEEAAPATP